MKDSNTFPITHAATKEVFQRPGILINPHHSYPIAQSDANPVHEQNNRSSGQEKTSTSTPKNSHNGPDPRIRDFHAQLPDYAITPLHEVPEIAKQLGVRNVFVKSEAKRFGLPSFKILGASWAVYGLLVQTLRNHSPAAENGKADEDGIDEDPTFEELKAALSDRKDEIKLVTCSAGNWGRAVARMGALLEVEVLVYLPESTSEETKRLIDGEGPTVRIIRADGDYDVAIAAAREEVELRGGSLVMDTSWEGFEEIPQYVVDGYSTMLLEIDEQVAKSCGKQVTMAIVSVGVGSWAQAVVSHYNQPDESGQEKRIVAVEPHSGACLMESLYQDAITPVQTGKTIMPGMNCGTVSTLAWPWLKPGTYAAVAVSDQEAHSCVQDLSGRGIDVGPCGAATLAAARNMKDAGLLEDPEAVVVLVSTEGRREYEIPQGA